MNRQVPNIFKEEKLQHELDVNGFVKIKLLEESDVKELSQLFNKYFPNPSKDFYSSSYENNYEVKKEISDQIGKLLLPNLENIFTNYTWFGSAFLSKGNGPRSEMPMHQDWTIVDETKFIALNIWTPLQNTNDENGTLEVIKGSHKWHSELRAPTLPFYYDGYQEQLKSKLVSIHTKATEAIVLNQAVIHYSKPNKTSDMRLAITTGIKTKDAPMIFHYWNKEEPNFIEQFKQEDNFLIRFTNFHNSIFQKPTIGKSNGKKPFKLKKVNDIEISTLLNSYDVKKHTSFIQKISRWIKS